MNHDFNEIIHRRGTRSMKWDTHPGHILPMWVADSDFRSPQPVIDAIQEVVARGVFGYTHPDGAFEAACAGWMSRRFGWNPSPAAVRWAPSVCVALASAVRAFTEPGDAVCMMVPVYPHFFGLTELNGRAVSASPLVRGHDDRWEIDFPDLESRLSRKETKLLLLCNPHNPVGRALTEDELRRVGDLCLRHGVTVFSDEIHGDIVLRGRHIPLPSLSPELAAISLAAINPSKTFNLADLRSAAVISENPELLDAFQMEIERLHLGRCSLGIAGVIAAYEHCADYADAMLEHIRGNLEFAADFIGTRCAPITTTVPEATFLLWLDCRGLGMAPRELEAFFLERAKLALNPGDSFGAGGEGFMRMNLACPRATAEEGLRRMEAALHGLRR